MHPLHVQGASFELVALAVPVLVKTITMIPVLTHTFLHDKEERRMPPVVPGLKDALPK